MKLLVRSALAVVFCALPSIATAQPGGNIDLQTFRPAMDSRGFITVNASQVLGNGEPSFGLVTTWGKNPLELQSGDVSYSVEHIITPTLVAAYGLRPFGVELEVGAALPFAIMSGDRQPDSDAGTPGDPNDDQRFGFDGQGLGDASLHLKWRMRTTSRPPGLGAALIASVSLPTASEQSSWLGSGAVVPQLSAVLDYEIGRIRLAGNAGFRFRPDERFVDDDPGMGPSPFPLTGGVIEAGTALPLGFAASYAVVPQRFDVIAESFSTVPVGGENYLPLEAIGGIKLYLANRSFLTLGGGAGLLGQGGNPDVRAFLGIVFEPNVGDRDGDGLKDDIDQCPDNPEDKDGFEDSDGCPDLDNDRDGIPDTDDGCPNDPEDKDGFEDEDGCPEGNEFDRDGDGILDDDDACPDEPEDMDGFEDADGCPDPDNDQDGILDIDDLCADEPEDFDDFEDTDGCPEPGPVIDTGGTIDILDKIHFEFDSAVIKPESHRILRAVARTIRTSPDIRRVEIQGHTDERGSAAYNKDLSQRRAESVMQFLIDQGVEAGRLEAHGYGESQPRDPAHTEAAWSENRRVEFIILDRTGD